MMDSRIYQRENHEQVWPWHDQDQVSPHYYDRSNSNGFDVLSIRNHVGGSLRASATEVKVESHRSKNIFHIICGRLLRVHVTEVKL